MKNKIVKLTIAVTSLIFGVTCLRKTSSVATYAEEEPVHIPVTVNVDSTNFIISDQTKDKNDTIKFVVPGSGSLGIEAAEDGKVENYFRANAASQVLKLVTKNGEESYHYCNICFENNKEDLWYINTDTWSEPKFFVYPGDKIILNGAATKKSTGDKIVFDNLVLLHTEYGFWMVEGTPFENYEYNENNVGSVSSEISIKKDTNVITNIFINFTINPDDSFVIKEGWDKYYENKTALKIYDASNDEEITNKSAFLLKRYSSQYSLEFINDPNYGQSVVDRSFFNFEDGDMATLNGSFNSNTGTTIVIVDFSNITFQYDASKTESARFSKVPSEVVAPLKTLYSKIHAIGDIKNTQESLSKIEEAKTYYNSLSETEKSYVTAKMKNSIPDAEAIYESLKPIELIDDIGTVVLSNECKEKIDRARAALNSLSSNAYSKVPEEKIAILEEAEKTYIDLVDVSAAENVISLIKEIGTVENTEVSKEKIDCARIAFNALSENAKSKVDLKTYKILVDAEILYESFSYVEDFKCLVGTLNANSTVNEIYSVLCQCKVIYDKLPQKSAVATELSILNQYAAKYNNQISIVNVAHTNALSKNNSIWNNVVAVAKTIVRGVYNGLVGLYRYICNIF